MPEADPTPRYQLHFDHGSLLVTWPGSSRRGDRLLGGKGSAFLPRLDRSQFDWPSPHGTSHRDSTRQTRSSDTDAGTSVVQQSRHGELLYVNLEAIRPLRTSLSSLGPINSGGGPWNLSLAAAETGRATCVGIRPRPAETTRRGMSTSNSGVLYVKSYMSCTQRSDRRDKRRSDEEVKTPHHLICSDTFQCLQVLNR